MEVTEILEHHGTKGMKWGVRKDRGHEGQRVKTKKLPKLDKKFERRAGTLGMYIDLHNRAAGLTNAHDVDRINNKPQYKDADFRRDSPLRRKYYKEHQKAYLDNVEKAANEMGTNASGTRKLQIIEEGDGNWTVSTTAVKHADGDVAIPDIRVTVNKDSMGHITSLEVGNDAAHSDVDVMLLHWGILGMKWGKRKYRGTVGSQKGKPRTDVSLDAKKAHDSHRKIHETHSTDPLSNSELQHLVNRINLEQQYVRLLSPKKDKSAFKKGQEFARETVSTARTMQDIDKLSGGHISGQIGKALARHKK